MRAKRQRSSAGPDALRSSTTERKEMVSPPGPEPFILERVAGVTELIQMVETCWLLLNDKRIKS